MNSLYDFFGILSLSIFPIVENNQSGSQYLKSVLPWWTWVAPFLIFFAASHFSALLLMLPGTAFIYFPTAAAIVLAYWWGPKRVVPAFYVNAIVNSYLWGIDTWYWKPFFAIPEALFVYFSWYLFIRRGSGKSWIPDTSNLNSFLFRGILVPLTGGMLLLKLVFFILQGENFNPVDYPSVTGWLREFICSFGFTLPVLYFLTPIASKSGLNKYYIIFSDQRYQWTSLTKSVLMAAGIAIVVMSAFMPFEKYWYLYGVLSLWIALRFGFGPAIVINTFIFLVIYFIPVITQLATGRYLQVEPDMVNIYLGTSLLFVFSVITGRIIDDVSQARRQITEQVMRLEKMNNELEVANKELDHFVYSVSHDLTSPLKSIHGLVNLSKITSDTDAHRNYFEKIGESVVRLELFIREVLDFSHIKRIEAVYQRVNIGELVNEITEGFKYMEGFDSVRIEQNGLETAEILTDKTSMKVILSNLIGNAIAYRKKKPEFVSVIKISAFKRGGTFFVQVEDNGEGIRPEIRKKIFEMFFRGSTQSKGSGLGLYIAQEAATRIKGTLSVESEHGSGSIFTLEIKPSSA